MKPGRKAELDAQIEKIAAWMESDEGKQRWVEINRESEEIIRELDESRRVDSRILREPVTI
jgi:hypothetical protein